MVTALKYIQNCWDELFNYLNDYRYTIECLEHEWIKTLHKGQ